MFTPPPLPGSGSPTPQILHLLPTPCSLLPKTQGFVPHPIDNCYYQNKK
ncbi:hypothetical protein [Moorena producens]|nr:hypothetical protein [Moorena producens]